MNEDQQTPTPEEIHSLSVSKGWWEDKRNLFGMDILGASELCEALEEYRNQKEGWEERFYTELADFYIRMVDQEEAEEECLIEYKEYSSVKKDSPISIKLGVVLNMLFKRGPMSIDTMFRLFDKEKILEAVIKKHEYNKTRPYRHGGKAC